MVISNLNILAAPPEEGLSDDDDADEDFPNRFTRNPLPDLSSSVLSALSMSPGTQARRTPTLGATPSGTGASGSRERREREYRDWDWVSTCPCRTCAPC